MNLNHDEQNLHHNNSFDSHKDIFSVIQVFSQQENSYPLSLQPENPHVSTTPISPLSSITIQSDTKKLPDSKNTKTNPISDKVVSRIETQTVEDNLREEVKHLTDLLNDLKCYTEILEKRNQEIAVALEKEKLKSNHLQVALSIIRKEDRQLDKKLNEQQDISFGLKIQLENERNVIQSQTQRLEQCQAENNYLKQLIMIANSNYQNLQKKYKFSTQKHKKVQEQNSKKQKQLALSINEMKNVLTDLISLPNYNTNTNHCLSFGQQDQNCLKKNTLSSNRNNKKQTQEIYRKMFIKTLKGTK